mgnify:CR=1 FL=1
MDAKEAGVIADNYKALDLQRLDLQRQADTIEREQKTLKAQLIEYFQTTETTAVSGTNGHIVSLVKKPQPIAESWPDIQAYIVENNAWELVQRRLSDAAIKERLEQGIEIPGVGIIDTFSLSVKKL